MNTDGKDIVSNVWGSLQAELFSLSPGEARGIMRNCCENKPQSNTKKKNSSFSHELTRRDTKKMKIV
jgi:hypothetical protein